jgi:hypothetical protein
MFRIFLAIFLVAFSLVCGATEPSESEQKPPIPALEKGKARIYFYRTGIFGAAYQPGVTLNG